MTHEKSCVTKTGSLTTCLILMSVLALSCSVGCAATPKPASPEPPECRYELDFRYQPPEWQTAICLVDDWQKTLVDKSGDMLYDFPGPFGDFATRVETGFADGKAEWVSQSLENARTPIVTTRLRQGPLDLELCAFAVAGEAAASLAPPEPAVPDAHRGKAIEAVGDHAPQRGWAAPQSGADAAFGDVDVGNGHPLRYRVPVPGVGPYQVFFGLCEGWWDEPGKRVLELKVEGQTRETVDPVQRAGKNCAFVVPVAARDENGNGFIDIEVAAASSAADKNTILNALWVFEEPPADADVISGAAKARARAWLACGDAIPILEGTPRVDLMRVIVRNTGSVPEKTVPRIRVRSNRVPTAKADTGVVCLRGAPFLSLSRPAAVATEKYGLTLALPAQMLAPGAADTFVVAMHRNAALRVWTPEETEEALRSTRAYWSRAGLPEDVVSVPDPNIQALFDSCVRNIWQAREIKDGLPAFQVGPTCYRGLWIVDGAFLLEATAMVGAGDQARAGIMYTLGKQQKSGAFEVLSPKYYKENGIVLWTCVRHAVLTQDKEWLLSVWPQLEKAFAYILELRRRSAEEPDWLCHGLIPPGDIDGGLSDPRKGEYTNVYWNLLGMKSAIGAARWLGKTEEAAAWQKEYDDFYAVFRRAAERDTRRDRSGNAYLPTIMGNLGNELPQRAQWAFCHAVYPGQLFDKDDPLVTGNLAMLAATEQEGMVYGTGWDPEGFWNYFASFYGHAWLWQGNGSKAAEILYAFANHATPTLAWREEQSPVDKPYKKVGDMPHNLGQCRIHPAAPPPACAGPGL